MTRSGLLLINPWCDGCEQVEQYFVDNLPKIDAFLTKLDTPPRLFFFHQQKVPGQGKKELFASTGEGVKLEGKCVYFVREKPCKTSVANDSDLLCGEVNSSILHSTSRVALCACMCHVV